MNKREPLLTEQYFDKSLSIMQQTILEAEEDANLPSDQMRHDLVYFDLFNAHYKTLLMRYSRGYPIESLVPELQGSLVALEKYRQQPQAEDFFFNGQQDEYMQALTLLSLALLLRVETDVFQRLVAAIGLNGQDYVLEWLAGRRLPGRPQTTQLLFPKTYARLRDAIQAPRDIQAQVLKGFLAGWYESLNTVWYNIHAHRADAAGFRGYWCWEAAAVAYGLGADDDALRPMRYYPADLADFAFGRPPRPA